MKLRACLATVLLGLFPGGASAIMERGDYPWDTKLRSYYDQEIADELGEVRWLLNLGPTGIRARIYPDRPDRLVVSMFVRPAWTASASMNVDVSYGPRTLTTASGAILLALGKRKLRITGAGTSTVAEESGSYPNLPAPVSARGARTLPEEHAAKLDGALLAALGELSQAGELPPPPMPLSKARAKVRLAGVGSDGKLTFQALAGDRQASFGYDDLTLDDHAILARLVARLRPSDEQAQGRAGVFLERAGDTLLADEYYKKIGEELRERIDALFE